jgi:hypothetical protein
LFAAIATSIFVYLYPSQQNFDDRDRLTYYWTTSPTHEFKTALNAETFVDANPNVRVSEQAARLAASKYIEKQVADGTLPKPQGISYVIPTSVWTVQHDYWLVRFHLDDDYTSGNFIEILVRMDGIVLEPEVTKRTDTAEPDKPPVSDSAG